MLPGQAMEDRRAAQVAAAARRAALARPHIPYPRWYLRRWHFLPEGYLSHRSVRLYEHVIRSLYNAGSEARARAALVGELRRLGATRILDLGCGPGLVLHDLARSMPHAELAGIDLSPYMLGRAAARLPAGVQLVHADARDLPFPGGRFDAVVSMHVLGHVPAAVGSAIAAEAVRVLAPHGTAYVVDHAWHPPTVLPGLRTVSGTALIGGLLRLRAARAPEATAAGGPRPA